MSKCAVFIDCNSIAASAAERKVGQIMGGRGNCPTTVVDVQHVLVNSDIGIFRIHFWQALC